MTEWERFARDDPYYAIWTEAGSRPTDEAIEAFFRSGEALTRESVARVEQLLRGRNVAIEIGCGAGRLAIPHARLFGEVRAVDIAPTMLHRLRENARAASVHNISTYLLHEEWSAPSAADYVYSFLVFQHIPSWADVEGIIGRIAQALGPRGVTQLQFDTRPATLAYRLRNLAPDAVLPAAQRRGIRRIRRSAHAVRDTIASSGLKIADELGEGTDSFTVVAVKA